MENLLEALKTIVSYYIALCIVCFAISVILLPRWMKDAPLIEYEEEEEIFLVN